MNKIKDLRLLGVIKDSEKRYTGKRSWEFEDGKCSRNTIVY